MEWSTIIPLVLMAAASGFAIYCLTCAIHVWRSRNNKESACRSGVLGPFAALVRRLSLLALVVGIGVTVTAMIAYWALPIQGVLHGDEVLTVRHPEELDVAWMTDQATVEPGQTVVRFTEPEHEATIDALRLRLKELQTERRMLVRTPVEPDPEIARELLEASSQQRHLRGGLQELRIEWSVVQRELVQQKVTKQDQINALAVELVELREQLSEIETVLAFNRKQFQRSEQLVERKVATAHEHEQWTRDVDVAEERHTRLQERIQTVERQRRQLEEGLAELVKTLDSQSESFAEQIATVEQQLEQAGAERASLEERLQADLKRAVAVREEELEQKDTQLEQIRTELDGLVDALNRESPFAGRIVYRAPSPRTVKSDEPLLVMTPQEGLRLRLRAPVWQRRAWEQSGTIPLQVSPPVFKEDGDAPHHFVERRFNGAFDHWQPLPADPWYGVVELTCDPPAEAAQQLAAGHQVLITPRWFTPLPTSPLFQAGIALSLCATLGLSATGLMQYRRGRVSEQDETDDDGPERHAIITEYGAEGAMLRVLGTQLRELVEYGNIDPHVLAAAEWALDRHRARAIRLMRDGLGPAGDLADSLDDLLERENIRARATGNGSGHRRGARRLLRLIEAIGDDPTRDQARRLLTQLEHRAQGPHQPPESLPLHYDESMLVE